jgi:pyridoxamine 5'-phosphate oxidase
MAMALATADTAGRPSLRMVLLKEVDERGFVFYTNLKSRKGKQLAANPQVALCFYWDPLREQVQVEGRVEPLNDDEADAYWATRPRWSQIGAWASHESRPLHSRTTLILRATGIAARYLGRPIPRPRHWAGFRVVPERIEFWMGRDYRIHHRFLYWKAGDRWNLTRLYP